MHLSGSCMMEKNSTYDIEIVHGQDTRIPTRLRVLKCFSPAPPPPPVPPSPQLSPPSAPWPPRRAPAPPGPPLVRRSPGRGARAGADAGAGERGRHMEHCPMAMACSTLLFAAVEKEESKIWWWCRQKTDQRSGIIYSGGKM